MTKKFLIDLKKWINCVCRQWIHCWWQWQFQFHLIDILCCVTCKCEQKLRLTFCANFKPRLMSPIFCKCSQCVLEFEIWAMWVKKPLACLQCQCSNATFVCCASLQQKSNDISLPAKSYCCSQMVVFHQAWNKIFSQFFSATVKAIMFVPICECENWNANTKCFCHCTKCPNDCIQLVDPSSTKAAPGHASSQKYHCMTHEHKWQEGRWTVWMSAKTMVRSIKMLNQMQQTLLGTAALAGFKATGMKASLQRDAKVNVWHLLALTVLSKCRLSFCDSFHDGKLEVLHTKLSLNGIIRLRAIATVFLQMWDLTSCWADTAGQGAR